MSFARLAAAFAVTVGLALAATPSFAAGSSSSSSSSSTSSTGNDYQAAEQKIKAADYSGAIPLLEKVVTASPRNADALNLLGFSHRKLGHKEKALAYYNNALSVNPKHLGANEYLGELYLQMGLVAKAEERLAVLSGACSSSCEEYSELKKQIDDFKAKQQSS